MSGLQQALFTQNLLRAVEEGRVSPELAKNVLSSGVETALDFTPVIGDVKALGYDAPKAFSQGDTLGGMLALGSVIPFVGDFAKKGYDAYKAASNAPDVFIGDPIKNFGDVIPNFKTEPEKTREAYKLFVKGEDNKLYPLFVDAASEVPQNTWLPANAPDVAFKSKRSPKSKEAFYVPTKGAKRSKGEKAKNTGDPVLIPDENTRQKLIEQGYITNKVKRTPEAPYGKVTAVAARPGWHSSTAPVAEHLGPQSKITKEEAYKLKKAGVNPKAIKTRTVNGETQYYVKRRAEDQVWAKVEMADDTSDYWQSMMNSRGTSDITDQVPRGGSYSYVDGQADGETWVVGGDMKISKVLSEKEAKQVQESMGVKDLPTTREAESILGRRLDK